MEIGKDRHITLEEPPLKGGYYLPGYLDTPG